MAVANRLNRVVALIYRLPAAWRTPLLSRLFGSQVKLAGTARVRVHEMTRRQATLSIANRRPVQNHIRGVHAAAMTLVASRACTRFARKSAMTNSFSSAESRPCSSATR